jgi:hypothetical protein
MPHTRRYDAHSTCRSGSEDEFADEPVDPRVEGVLEAMTVAMELVGNKPAEHCCLDVRCAGPGPACKVQDHELYHHPFFPLRSTRRRAR